MLAKIKYKLDKNSDEEKIIEVQLPCKPNIEDFLFIDGIGTLMVIRVMIVGRELNDRRMKRPQLMVTCVKATNS